MATQPNEQPEDEPVEPGRPIQPNTPPGDDGPPPPKK